MTKEELKFGTSGVRGRVIDFTEDVSRRYAASFGAFLKRNYPQQGKVFISRDLRDSSPMIQSFFTEQLSKDGFQVFSLGEVPTPALALYAQAEDAASIMVTGSHIPADRNGVKFYTPSGEITKNHENEIRHGFETLAGKTFQNSLQTQKTFPGEKENQLKAETKYLNRYLNFFGGDFLAGAQVLFYEHSTVGRDVFPKILKALGAEVKVDARSATFIPVDTENVSNVELLNQMMRKNDMKVLVSADGDADRPLVVHHRHGQIIGDLLGLMTAMYLDQEAIAVPVSCTSLLESSMWFKHVERTKIGSPFVISGMEDLQSKYKQISGFEANGGYLLGCDVRECHGVKPKEKLLMLPTRDAVLPIVIYLKMLSSGWVEKNESFLFSKFNVSGLLKDFSSDRSRKVLTEVDVDPPRLLNWDTNLKSIFGSLKNKNTVDGVKLISETGVCVHLRPSGNAPEFRVYIEAGSKDEAELLLKSSLNFCETYR